MKIKKLSLCMPWGHMGNGVIDSCIINLALDVGEWSDSCPCLFNSGKESLLPIEQKVEWAPDVLQMDCFGGISQLLFPPAMELWFLGHPVHVLLTTSTELLHLLSCLHIHVILNVKQNFLYTICKLIQEVLSAIVFYSATLKFMFWIEAFYLDWQLAL